jgi:hypothetical protein
MDQYVKKLINILTIFQAKQQPVGYIKEPQLGIRARHYDIATRPQKN